MKKSEINISIKNFIKRISHIGGKMNIKNKVMEYAYYTINKHSSMHDDIDMLNKIFGLNISIEEVMRYDKLDKK